MINLQTSKLDMNNDLAYRQVLIIALSFPLVICKEKKVTTIKPNILANKSGKIKKICVYPTVNL